MPKLIKKDEHWYITHTIECPVCGSSDTWKERRYGKKPKDPRKCRTYEQKYDWCEE